MTNAQKLRKERLDAIDIRGAMFQLGITEPNAELYKTKIACLKTGALAKVEELEQAAQDFAIQVQQEENDKKAKRLQAESKLLDLGLTIEDLKALLEN